MGVATADETTQATPVTNVTVFLAPPFHNPAYSIFKTRTLMRYGSGRIQNYDLQPAGCKCDNETVKPATKMPCLIVSKDCPAHTLKCRYPQCKTVVTNDEFCQRHDFDVRQYYTSDRPDTLYIPLGPRIDSWMSFQNIKTAQGD